MTQIVHEILQKAKISVITFCGRSGSIFLQSLFDGHPDIISIPISGILQSIHKPWENDKLLDKKYALEIFDHYIPVICDASAKITNVSKKANKVIGLTYAEGYCPGDTLGFCSLGEGRDVVLKVDESIFRETLHDLLRNFEKISFLEFFTILHLAYWVSNGGEIDDLIKKESVLILYQLHVYQVDFFQKLLEEFPKNIYHLQMVRNPIAATGSHLVMSVKINPDFIASQLIYRDIKTGFDYINHPRLKTISIRLEDLHNFPEQILKNCCSWLGIEWHPTLLLSTFGSIKYWNVKDSDQVSGFNKITTSKKYDSVFSLLDIFRLKIIMREKFIIWKYQNKKYILFTKLIDCCLFLFLSIFPYRFILKYPNKKESRIIEHLYFSKLCFLFLISRIFGNQPSLIDCIEIE